MQSQIESLLFISAKPMSVKQISDLIGKTIKDTKEALDKLVLYYQENKHGIQVISNDNKYQMVSSPENTKLIAEYLKDETSGELSRPSLESLTIIAYRGPISKLDLERIRGVNCSLILRNLAMRGLVDSKIDKQKNETYYSVTMDFVRFLGLSSVKELPDFERLSKDDSIERMLGDVVEEAADSKSSEEDIIIIETQV